MISAILLAAGQATRFGQCKQLVPLGGKPLLQHALDNLRASSVEHVVVVLGANAAEIREQIRFDHETVVENPDYAGGMSTSIRAGLGALPETAEAAMIVLGDQPYVSPRTLNALCDEFRRTHAEVIVPTFDGARGNPVIVSRALFPEMMEIRGDVGCRAIFGQHEIAKLAVDDRGILTDIDTPADVPETIVELRKKGQPFVIATVVRAERPTSSKPGDKAIIAVDGTLMGWIGGSCAHDLVVKNALEAIEQRAPRLLSLSSGTSGPDKEGVVQEKMQCYSGGALDVFIEPNLPRPHIVVVGDESIARAVARLSRAMDFRVTVVGEDLNVPAADAIIIATHGRYDEEAIEQAARTSAPYIALVASPKRAAVLLQNLRDRGVETERIKAPAGLDIGAEGAEEIALSIVAEIVQRRHAVRTAGSPARPQPAEAIDPICNMTVAIDGARYTSERDGRRYYFCCAHCQRVFEQAHVA